MLCALPPVAYIWGENALEVSRFARGCTEIRFLKGEVDIVSLERKVQKSRHGFFAFVKGIKRRNKTSPPKQKGNKRAKSGSKEAKDRSNDAENLLKYLPITVTGARPGELVVGTKDSVQGFSFEITKQIFPSKDAVELLLGDKYKNRFFQKLHERIPYFTDKTDDQIEKYLEENKKSFSARGMIGEKDPLQRLKVLDFGTNTALHARFTNKEEIFNKPQTCKFLKESIPRESWQKEPLVFSRKYYAVDVKTSYYSYPNSRYVLDLGSGTLQAITSSSSSSQSPRSLTRQKLLQTKRIVFARINDDLSIATTYQTKWNGSKQKEILQQYKSHEFLGTLKLSPSVLKSLLQKLIRFSPENVQIGSNTVSSKDLLCWTALKLVFHSGSFVPNIQKFVAGATSFFKRAGVIYFEDAFHESMNPLQFFGAALLTRQDSQWFPSEEFLFKCIHDLEKILDSKTAFDYDKSKKQQQKKINVKNPLHSASYMLDILRSFDGDLQMVRFIADHSSWLYPLTDRKRPVSMPIYHCIDQHAAPNVVYLFKYEEHKDLKKNGSKPFSRLIRKIFKEVTNMNPRKQDLILTSSFFKEVRACQEMYWKVLTNPPFRTLIEGPQTFEFAYNLDPMWIAAMIGQLRVGFNRKKFYVSIASVKPLQFQVVRVPSRHNKEEEIPLGEIEGAKREALRKLGNGVPFEATTFTLPNIDHKKYKVKLDHQKRFYLQSSSQRLWWDEQMHLEQKVPYTSQEPTDVFIKGTGVCGVQDLTSALHTIIADTSQEVKFRLLQVIDHFDPVVTLPAVGRDGGGTEQAVRFEDMAVFAILCKLCRLAPGAFRFKNINTFTTPNLILRRYITDLLQGLVAYDTTSGFTSMVRKREDKRTLKPEQKKVFELLDAQYKSGKKGFGMFITAGFGKTFTFLNFFYNNRDTMPQRLVWSVNKAAMKGIYEEMSSFIPETEIYIIRTNKNEKDVKDYLLQSSFQNCIHFNGAQMAILRKKNLPTRVEKQEIKELPTNTFFLIEHDSLRKATALDFDNSFFVMDEFHKALSEKTQRTQAALRFASCARQFAILSGTPTINNDVYNVIPWLRKLAPFEVTPSNFFVAMGMAVSVHKPGPMKIIDRDILVGVDEEYKQKVPPALGGLLRTDDRLDIQRINKFCVDNYCTPKMIELVKNSRHKGVMVIAMNDSHASTLFEQISQFESNTIRLTRGNFLSLTPHNVESKKVPDYKVVIVPQRHSTGFNLSTLSVIVTSIYPSNAAQRSQLLSRVNREGNPHKDLVVYRVIAKHLMEKIYAGQEKNDSFLKIVKDLQSLRNGSSQ